MVFILLSINSDFKKYFKINQNKSGAYTPATKLSAIPNSNPSSTADSSANVVSPTHANSALISVKIPTITMNDSIRDNQLNTIIAFSSELAFTNPSTTDTQSLDKKRKLIQSLQQIKQQVLTNTVSINDFETFVSDFCMQKNNLDNNINTNKNFHDTNNSISNLQLTPSASSSSSSSLIKCLKFEDSSISPSSIISSSHSLDSCIQTSTTALADYASFML
ncbi:hypothetical protein [Candidatus Phytoplasma melaleucae]|uniref:Effector n=1 Tax=Candidatus Phytoplasma melaleucae TaxID=2982630 RepID=A0ABT9DDG8_9MOLU|nr:hypothetical protein ['Melaleuca sp.' phytoplasma]MDO8168092.1 hypothetical protein ['Melaleuca sp.' phytoplasma]